tara:strand:- start:870 stop:1421 length:552 start_codon:yes stop_codon:yes gene_type:complete
MNYKFTTDWTWKGKKWKFIKSNLPSDNINTRCLEIGAFEGRTTITLSKYFDYVDVVDPWKDYWDIPDASEAYERFKHNTQECNNIVVYRDESKKILPLLNHYTYDLIYIDGDHSVDAVYNDIKMSCNLLKEDGVIIIDDYKEKTLPEVRLGVIKWLEEDNNLHKIHFQSDNKQCCFKFKKDIY